MGRKVKYKLSEGMSEMSNRRSDILQKIRRVADYQFGKGVGDGIFPDDVTVAFSKRTGKIRHIYLDRELLATLKPRDGLFSLGIEGARRLANVEPKRLWVIVQEEAVDSVGKGGDVFARHVVDADLEIRPREEVIVLNGSCRLVAVGKAILSGREMRDFSRGVAVRVRRGSLEKVKKEKEAILGQ